MTVKSWYKKFKKLIAQQKQNNGTSDVIIENASTKIPRNTKDFLCNTKNKLQLVQFLCQSASNYVTLNNSQNMFISGGFPNIEKCYMLFGNTTSVIPQLQTAKLEADTRIFCHATYSIERDSQMVIHATDTDIFVLAIHFWGSYRQKGCRGIFFQMHGRNARTLACHVAAEFLSPRVCQCHTNFLFTING